MPFPTSRTVSGSRSTTALPAGSSPAAKNPRAREVEPEELRRLQLWEALRSAAAQIVLAMGEIDQDLDCSQRLLEAQASLQEAVTLSPLGSAA